MEISNQEKYKGYHFLLSGQGTTSITFRIDASTSGSLMAILRKDLGWHTFATENGLVSVDFSKITAIYPEQL